MSLKPDHDAAQVAIEALISNPPPRQKRDPGLTFPENAGAAMDILRDVNGFRAKLAKDRGMTIEQWLALEAEVSHPREFIEVRPSHRTIARRRMVAAGVPEEYIACVADREPEDCRPYQVIRGFLNSKDGFHVLSGGKGTRKTGSAAWALGQIDGGAFIEAPDVVKVSIEQKDRWEHIVQKAPLVVLDDVGTEKRTGDLPASFGAAFSDLVNKVYGGRRRLIITCNLTRETFRSTYGDREFDRIRHVGKWSDIAGQSVRQYTEREPGCDDD